MIEPEAISNSSTTAASSKHSSILSCAELIVRKRPSGTCSKCRLSILLFLSQRESYRKYGEPLFSENLRKEKNQPYPECALLSGAFEKGQTVISAKELEEFKGKLNRRKQVLLLAVLRNYGTMTSLSLLKELNQDPAWKETKPGKAISFE
jgi:uncharacterized phage-associated protein